MSYAPQYNPTVSFANEESSQVSGRSTVRTVAVDTELANVSSSLNGINNNLQKLQRDDNKLLDGIVEPYALSEQTRALLAAKGMPRGYWAPGVDYSQGDSVVFSNTSYLCFISHTSTVTFDTGKFMAISGDGSSFASAQEAAASAAQALSSANSAMASASSASGYATAANASATAASSSAGSAESSASSAAASATAASNVVASSVQPASQAEAEAGANNTKFMSALRVAQAIASKIFGLSQLDRTGPAWHLLASNGAGNAPSWLSERFLGVNQTLQNVTSSRALNTTYTNSTGKPIFVSIHMAQTVGGSANLQIDGGSSYQSSNQANAGISLVGVVPAGSTYRVVPGAGTGSLVYWSELRA